MNRIAERVISTFEAMLPDWRAERARLRAEADRQLNLNIAAAADAERRAMAQADCNRLAAPQILELARGENVTLTIDDGGNIIATGTPSPLLRAHIRLNREDVIATIRHRSPVPVLRTQAIADDGPW